MKGNNRLKNLNRGGQQLLEQLNTVEANQHVWEGTITRINSQIQRLKDLGVVHSSIVLGPVVLQRDYGVDGPTDTSEVIQAGLSSDCGLVAIFWDTDDMYAAHRSDQSSKEWDAIDRARPLSECSPIVRWLVAKHSNGLLESLINSSGVMLPG